MWGFEPNSWAVEIRVCAHLAPVETRALWGFERMPTPRRLKPSSLRAGSECGRVAPNSSGKHPSPVCRCRPAITCSTAIVWFDGSAGGSLGGEAIATR